MTCESNAPRLTPRTLTVHFVSRAEAGELQIETRVERAGRSLWTLSARAVQGDRLVALGLAALGEDRPGPEFHAARFPRVPPPENLKGPTERLRARGPVILDHFEMRFAIGKPLTGGAPRAGGWIRFRDPRRPDDLLTVTLADMWMPSPYVTLKAPLPCTTVELTVNFLARPEGSADDAWFLTVFESPGASAGFFREEGEVWTPDGRLLARSSQLATFLDARPGQPPAPGSGQH